MELKWLEDFVNLAETRNFSRSAEARNVTQPAFSRRIQALEAWVGVPLIDRTTYPTKLTRAGEQFFERAVDLLRQIYRTREIVRGQSRSPEDTIDFALPHTLSLTFFPNWLLSLEATFGTLRSRLIPGNVHDAVTLLVEGGCDIVMTYHHPSHPVQLDPVRYDMLLLGMETLYPYSRADSAGKPIYKLPGKANSPIPYLAYTHDAYLARMADLILSQPNARLFLEKSYETPMSESLKMMALAGHGLAFLPGSAVVREVKQRQLVSAGDEWSCQMEIRIYREKPRSQAPAKEIVNRLWTQLSLQL